MRGGTCECTHASTQGLSVCAQHAIVLPRINPKTHSETSVLKQVFCIHSGMGLRNAVGNRGLRVRPEPVCRLSTLMCPQFTGLCAHTIRVYAPIVYGLMRPYRMGLCARSLRAYAPMPYGSMSPQFMGLRARISGSYGFTLHGVVFAAGGGALPDYGRLWRKGLLRYRAVYFKRPIYSTQVSRPFAKSVRSCTMTLSGRSGLGL